MSLLPHSCHQQTDKHTHTNMHKRSHVGHHVLYLLPLPPSWKWKWDGSWQWDGSWMWSHPNRGSVCLATHPHNILSHQTTQSLRSCKDRPDCGNLSRANILVSNDKVDRWTDTPTTGNGAAAGVYNYATCLPVQVTPVTSSLVPGPGSGPLHTTVVFTLILCGPLKSVLYS